MVTCWFVSQTFNHKWNETGGFSPIVHAQALYIDKDHATKKPSAIEKPKKPKVPEDQVRPPKVKINVLERYL